ncbi:conserved hypothetical protein [Beutenbergia cavernae DSM 12333]|uniref:LytR/CpsA/Psr regulator C-terminal domain-containing protein n=1 Tax=Beutenbergia cavernae (strain ATCC BAA-8 / DSM 12333 / CCUG 43141 / JCM 11478 / NBRC 16432 / NCIMB 13614 / HKI 0122) TaxID=471853 RepID=C5BZA4_BEUC1|nr:LytR C-terminal domain-containing protein [Beutenbergia cavernae]ACQ79076.1 conserved hypothetical protein [Beutenbergia cavernae DSM 12333]
MSTPPGDYPEDEFDVLGRDRTPQGVHRVHRSRWHSWWPFLLVIILAPVLAIVAVRILDREGTLPLETPSASSSAQPTGEGTASPTSEPTEEPTTPAPAIDQSVEVSVLNGAGISGLAGEVQAQLEGAGWTAVTAGNYQSAQPDVSTIYYANADLADEAQAIATALGIGPVEEYDGVPSITVVLRPDFAG